MSRVGRTRDFLRSKEIGPESVNVADVCEEFIEAMKLGLDGGQSSLPMLPTYISIDHEIPIHEPVIVIDAGGTNLRACTVQFDEKMQPDISNFRKRQMPGFDREVSADEFFSIMAEFVEPVIGLSSRIGFCFSYAAEIAPDRDGRLLYFSKEIKAPEVCGKKIGANLLAALGKGKAGHITSLTLLNDTVATLLSARAASAHKTYDGYIGFILGTGTNTCYLEQNSNIGKISDLGLDGAQIVNVESGGYAFNGSKLDTAFYESTKDAEMYKFEKLISGAYLGPYCGMVIGEAVREGLLSRDFGEKFPGSGAVNTIVMDSFLHDPQNRDGMLSSCCSNAEDEHVLYLLLDSVIERAGKLTAANLSAAVLKSDIGKNPVYPACINADGTTFHKTHNLRRYTEHYLDQYLTREMMRYYEIISIDNAPTLGAAIAGLLS